MNTPRFLNRHIDVEKTTHHLPHWEQPGRCYFVTFRMADSIPAKLRNEWMAEREQWLEAHPKPHSPEETGEYQQKFTARIERWLDSAQGSCVLRQSECREIIAGALQVFEARRYHLHSWVIMPNHVHVLLSLQESEQLGKILSSWKSYTANRLNDLLGLDGPFWQEDYFDRLVRDEEHFVRCVRYIRRNPIKAHLPPEAYSIWEDALSRQWAPPGEGSS
ncbi:REP-associated tyrosine transposase [Prosthecobacter sp.]|uniref:REP-associated tyrosine transposase n=1 Tax=Prosthecobacter sp. TaxID=1965333 RepID=UPI003783870D